MLILSEINDHKIQIKGVVLIPSAFNVLHFRLRVNDGVLFNCFSFYDPVIRNESTSGQIKFFNVQNFMMRFGPNCLAETGPNFGKKFKRHL